MKHLVYIFVAVGMAVGFQASANQVLKGEAARQLYSDMIELQKKNPKEMTSYVNGYFGDSERPHLGKLWVTTIYPTSTKDTFCYEYDFRESNVKEYLCDIVDEHKY